MLHRIALSFVKHQQHVCYTEVSIHKRSSHDVRPNKNQRQLSEEVPTRKNGNYRHEELKQSSF